MDLRNAKRYDDYTNGQQRILLSLLQRAVAIKKPAFLGGAGVEFGYGSVKLLQDQDVLKSEFLRDVRKAFDHCSKQVGVLPVGTRVHIVDVRRTSEGAQRARVVLVGQRRALEHVAESCELPATHLV